MSMSLPHLPGSHSGERGFTLVETLVAILAGLIVISATFSVLDVSLTQSSRIADRVSADQRGRIAMEKIMLELHSSCVAAGTTPVEPESTENKLLIVSQTGSNASFANVELHKISLEEEKLIDTSYLSTNAKPAPEWEFSKTPSSTKTLLNGVTKSGSTPVFQYFKYEGGQLSKTPLKTPLIEPEASETAAITVSFTTAPESGTVGKIAGARTVDLVNTAVLRFSPASPSGANLPCA
jgi:prepilin-type N-terminal cleavage/methylation domain-containing protein